MTYSIIARDPETGDIGGAMQSHFFNAGVHALFAEPGAGIVAAQMMAERAYGTRGLDAMRTGMSASDALESARASDPAASTRQVAMIDANGFVAAFTGAQCVAHSAHALGYGTCAQAAMCKSAFTAEAMLSAYCDSSAPFAERLVDALDAAEHEGGDLRGQKSAVLLVVRGTVTAEPWRDRLVDLRVEDDARPLLEIRRLAELHRFHARANTALELALQGNVSTALDVFDVLERENADDPDVAFRHALVLTITGRAERARERLEACYQLHDDWREMVMRLPAAGLLPDDSSLLSVLTGPLPTTGRRRQTADDVTSVPDDRHPGFAAQRQRTTAEPPPPAPPP
jgi:uncharacterized Ntn-hydrolase superfamily protein